MHGAWWAWGGGCHRAAQVGCGHFLPARADGPPKPPSSRRETQRTLAALRRGRRCLPRPRHPAPSAAEGPGTLEARERTGCPVPGSREGAPRVTGGWKGPRRDGVSPAGRGCLGPGWETQLVGQPGGGMRPGQCGQQFAECWGLAAAGGHMGLLPGCPAGVTPPPHLSRPSPALRGLRAHP